MSKTIGIIGAGQMGSGIVHVCALAGYDIRLSDVSAEALDKALGTIERNMARQCAKGKISEAEKNKALKRIRTGTELSLFRDCDMVIEAATEKEELKREIFKNLVPNLKPDALIA